MSEMYRSTKSTHNPDSPAVLAVHCSDPRYLPHFREFLHKGLGLERYALIAVPGGAQCLVPSDALPKFAWVGWRWTKFMVRLMSAERIILIGHEDCQWYATRSTDLELGGLRQRQQEDLQEVGRLIGDRFHRSKVETYFATLENDAAIFETL